MASNQRTAFATLTALLLLGAGFTLTSSQPAHAAIIEFTDDNGITYTVNDDNPDAGATTTRYSSSYGPEVTIPHTVTHNNIDYPVTVIGETSFSAKNLSHVTIPDSVITIGERAFIDNHLTSVNLGNSVDTIGTRAFYGNSLTQVVIPSSVTTIGSIAFGDNSITDLVIPNSVTSIGSNAFAANSITDLVIPNSVTAIENFAFADNSITDLVIPNSVTSIGNYAFDNNNLTDITIPSLVTYIGNYAFHNNNLTDITIPSLVTYIGFKAFEGNSLTHVAIGNSVATIGSEAFAHNSLTDVSIPGSVTEIGHSAFVGNPFLSTVIFEGDAPSINRAQALGSFGVAHGKTLCFSSGATGFETPVWEDYQTAVCHTVTFDANGGVGAAFSQTAPPPSALIVNGFTRDWHDFAGWNTEPGGTGESYSNGDNYDFIADVTVYAQWDIHTYNVTFDTGVGTVIGPATIDHGAYLSPPDDPTRDGHTFTGWYYDEEATNEYNFGSPVTDNLTLYAGWDINTYTVTFDTGVGTVIGPATIDHGASLSPPDSPTRDGHTFTGWYTDQNATNEFDFDTDVTGDFTLYAGWEPLTVPVVIEEDVTPPVVIEGENDDDQLAATGGTLNTPILGSALLAMFTGAALLGYRRWAHTTT